MKQLASKLLDWRNQFPASDHLVDSRKGRTSMAGSPPSTTEIGFHSLRDASAAARVAPGHEIGSPKVALDFSNKHGRWARFLVPPLRKPPNAR